MMIESPNNHSRPTLADHSRFFVRYIGFPAALVLLTCVLLLAPGVESVYGALVALVGAGILFERILPYHAAWNEPRGDVGHDLLHALTTVLVAPAVAVLLTKGVLLLGKFLPPLDLGARGLPLFVALPFVLATGSLLPYWLHRWSHEGDGILWRAHAVHHTPERVYWLNSLRLHPLNVAWNGTGLLVPLLLGFGPEVIFMAGILNNFVSIYNHLNVDFRLGPLNWIFNMNELHRWHHSRILSEANANYSSGALVFWDVVFGTRSLPGRVLGESGVGLSVTQQERTPYVRQLLQPFCGCGAG